MNTSHSLKTKLCKVALLFVVFGATMPSPNASFAQEAASPTPLLTALDQRMQKLDDSGLKTTFAPVATPLNRVGVLAILPFEEDSFLIVREGSNRAKGTTYLDVWKTFGTNNAGISHQWKGQIEQDILMWPIRLLWQDSSAILFPSFWRTGADQIKQERVAYRFSPSPGRASHIDDVRAEPIDVIAPNLLAKIAYASVQSNPLQIEIADGNSHVLWTSQVSDEHGQHIAQLRDFGTTETATSYHGFLGLSQVSPTNSTQRPTLTSPELWRFELPKFSAKQKPAEITQLDQQSLWSAPLLAKGKFLGNLQQETRYIYAASSPTGEGCAYWTRHTFKIAAPNQSSPGSKAIVTETSEIYTLQYENSQGIVETLDYYGRYWNVAQFGSWTPKARNLVPGFNDSRPLEDGLPINPCSVAFSSSGKSMVFYRSGRLHLLRRLSKLQ